MELNGKVALVTGGARRVGRALSLGLARAGASVVVNYRDSAAEAASVVEEIRSLGGEAIAVRADLGVVDGVRGLIERTRSELGRLDVLVNSAAVFVRRPFDEITETEWDRVLAINLKGPFFLSQAAAPLLRETGGAIVNIGDLSALQAWPSFAHHAIAKAGLLHMTRVLARALAPAVRVNAILPGNVLPPEGYEAEDWGTGGQDRVLTAREGEPADVVAALLYLLGGDFLTGEVLVVDGGRRLL
ncbi:MAG: SDR family oxidoreductase [Gemmatimonadota bacterium]|jgi:NAD(P)-dependent dehydrogenase (short-subunit alcohol dehydrogenase family)